MKKLLGLSIGLSLICLLSVQAMAKDSAFQTPQRRFIPVGYNHFVATIQTPVPYLQQVNPQDAQAVKAWGANNSATKQLQQFNQQTQQELSGH